MEIINLFLRLALWSLFHNEMSEGIAAGTFPLPISLANAEVYITDCSGRGGHAQLLFVSPDQINFLIPDWVKAGIGKVEVFHFTGYNTAPFATGHINIETVAPNVFTALYGKVIHPPIFNASFPVSQMFTRTHLR